MKIFNYLIYCGSFSGVTSPYATTLIGNVEYVEEEIMYIFFCLRITKIKDNPDED